MDVASLKAQIKALLLDADRAELYGQHSHAIGYLAAAEKLIWRVRDLEEAAYHAQDVKHDLVMLEVGQ
jgi:hypothetical protein